MNQSTTLRLALLAALAPLLAACAQQSPRTDAQMEQAVRLLTVQQVRNPGAARNAPPPDGIDGRAAASAYAQYQKSFQAPEPQPQAFTIGIGGGTAKGK
ncbi:hypothetical protein [Pseudoduganella sp. UC29_71]|jgi:hypothetical protein|uniref:hypothetical protein n=1 Tax=Pseudoduganella sp. UC29_71 TaxID=3350174 RepID=UPI000D302832